MFGSTVGKRPLLSRGAFGRCLLLATVIFGGMPTGVTAVAGQDRVVGRAELQQLRGIGGPAAGAGIAAPPTRELYVVGGGATSAIPADTGSIRLEPGQMVVSRLGALPDRVVRPAAPIAPADIVPATPDDGPSTAPGVTDEALALPYGFLAPAEDPAAGMRRLRAVYHAYRPLRFDRESGLFTGSFLLALEDQDQPNASLPLAGSVRLQFAGEVETVMPDRLSLEHTNLPLHEVRVATRAPVDSVRIRIIPDFDLTGVDVWMAVSPILNIETPPRDVQGFGIQAIPVTVSLMGGRSDLPVTVSFDADRGIVEPASVEIPPGGVARIRLRSEGVGTARLRAYSTGVDAAELEVRFVWPVLFLLSAVLGGAGGGLAAAYIKPKEGEVAPRVPRSLAIGVGFGILAAILYYTIGLNVLGLDLDFQYFSEGAVFALAALGGLLLPKGLRLPGTGGEPE